MFHVKRIFAVLAVVLVLALSVVSAFAAPTSFPAPTLTGGALSQTDTTRLARAVAAQFAFISSTSFSPQTVEPLAILANDLGGDQWEYTVVLAPPSATVGVIPEDWGARGATIPIGSNYVYRAKYSFSPSGGIGTWHYVYNASGNLVLGENEWMVYLFKGVGSGLQSAYPSFPWGAYAAIPAVDNWLNAMAAFEGALSPEKVEEAREAGHLAGLREGRLEGEADGLEKANEYWRTESARLEAIAREEGDREGYLRAVRELGEGDNAAYVLDIPAIFSAIPASAKAIINSAFGFEIFGINVAGLLSVVLIVSVVGFIVAKLSSR